MKYVGAIIEHPQNGYLLQQRDGHAPTYPFYWTLFGGTVKDNEKPKEAIIRELDEELSLTKKLILRLHQIQRNIQANGSEQLIYHVQTNADISTLQLREGKQMRYFDKDEILNRKFAFNIREVIINFLSQ